MQIIRCLFLPIILFICNGVLGQKVELKNNIDSVSYAIGIDIGSNVLKNFKEANYNLIINGVNNALNNKDKAIDDVTSQNIIKKYFQAKTKKISDEMKEEGIKFLEKNKKKEGVNTTKSGLQYIIITEGKGKKPLDSSTVKVHYHGTTIDGKVFDSSVDRKEPISFPLNRVIKGWTEGVKLMSEGSKYKFFIPSELAYGVNPPPGQNIIKANEVLIFEVELLKIEK